MKHLAANRFRGLVAVVLTVGLSVCCCQAHLLFAGGVQHPGPGAIAAAIDSCCESCPDDAPDDRRPAPSGCRTCCIKGTGLKDKIALVAPAAAAIQTLALPNVVVARAAPAPPVMVARVDPARLRVEPRTLLRLRCALVV